jgi:hypothetical protein
MKPNLLENNHVLAIILTCDWPEIKTIIVSLSQIHNGIIY